MIREKRILAFLAFLLFGTMTVTDTLHVVMELEETVEEREIEREDLKEETEHERDDIRFLMLGNPNLPPQGHLISILTASTIKRQRNELVNKLRNQATIPIYLSLCRLKLHS